ncbi:hypothetical protein C8Q70DRAFT_600286 [Cubamyces menziesii]|nr:hypothetical protein C8Q70DRAFT_600286 [Cubamyces menziesii]
MSMLRPRSRGAGVPSCNCPQANRMHPKPTSRIRGSISREAFRCRLGTSTLIMDDLTCSLHTLSCPAGNAKTKSARDSHTRGERSLVGYYACYPTGGGGVGYRCSARVPGRVLSTGHMKVWDAPTGARPAISCVDPIPTANPGSRDSRASEHVKVHTSSTQHARYAHGPGGYDAS